MRLEKCKSGSHYNSKWNSSHIFLAVLFLPLLLSFCVPPSSRINFWPLIYEFRIMTSPHRWKVINIVLYDFFLQHRWTFKLCEYSARNFDGRATSPRQNVHFEKTGSLSELDRHNHERWVQKWPQNSVPYEKFLRHE